MNGWQSLGFKSYVEYLESNIWQEKRDYFLKLFPKCADCGNKATNVHHLSYERCGNETKSDLIPLCFKCHKKRHNK